MKTTLIACLTAFSVVLVTPHPLEARGSGNKKPNASKNNNQARNNANRNANNRSSSNRSSSNRSASNRSSNSRNPLTQSRVSKPVGLSGGLRTGNSQYSKPAPKPSAKPANKNNAKQAITSNRVSDNRGNSGKGSGKGNNSKGGNSKGNNSKGNNSKKPPISAQPRLQIAAPSPGVVKYPGRPTNLKPVGGASRPGGIKKPSQAGSRNNANRGNSRHNHRSHSRPNRVNQVIASNYVRNNWDRRWTQSNSIWNQRYTSVRGPVIVNNNYRNSLNYAHRPNAWGSRPWWCSQSYHSWHRGSWNYGYNNRYSNRHRYLRPGYHSSHYLPGYHSSHSSISSAIPWGIAAWSLGKLIFDTGYSSYRNPYPAPPVQTRTTVYNYAEPITVVASKEEPLPESEEANDAEKSSAALERSRTLFSQKDYLGALKAVDESISYVPGDPALHEFRALTLFALGQYGEAAGVLNPVLAAGPGWDWETMIGFYQSSDTYTQQLRKLEDYVSSNDEAAAPAFLLGYHYMVAGFLEEAYQVFARVAELEPNDRVASQLRDLAYDSIPTDDEAEETDGTDPTEAEEPIMILEPEEIAGTWKATSAEGKTITLNIPMEEGFRWEYEGAGEDGVLSGEWSIDDNGLLVLDDEDAQLVARIELTEEGAMKFVLAGSPDSDPGLVFERE